jgi:hypothetical protein
MSEIDEIFISFSLIVPKRISNRRFMDRWFLFLNDIMRKAIVSIILALVLISLPVASRAQTGLLLNSGGTPTVTGTVAGTPASTQSAIGTTLTATLNFGDVSLNNTNPQVIIVMPIRVTTTSSYSVRVQATTITAGSGVQAVDIGFGVGNFRFQSPGSGRHTANGVSGIVTSGNFGTDPTVAANNTDGQPQFQATLGNISTASPTQIFSGPTTWSNGPTDSDGASVLADLTFVIVPQLFLSTASFTVVLTITIA